MKKIIFFLIAFLGFYQGAFAFDVVSSPTFEQRGLYVHTGAQSHNDQTMTWYGSYIGTEYQIGFHDHNFYLEEEKNVGLPSGIHMVTFPLTSHNYKYLVSDTSTGYIRIPLQSFYSSPYLIEFTSTQLKYYSPNFTNMTLGSIIQTISKPSSGFAIKNWTTPVYLSGFSGSSFLAYQGTDGKPYKVLDTFVSGSDTPITLAGTGPILPLGNFYTNDLILARQNLGSGSLYVQDGASGLPNFELSRNNTLMRFNSFSNPVAYFNIDAPTNSYANGQSFCGPSGTGGLDYRYACKTVVKWDMNCQTPGYDSCILSSGVFKCSNSSGSLSPGGELCGGTITPPISTPSSTSFGQTTDSITATMFGTQFLTWMDNGSLSENGNMDKLHNNIVEPYVSYFPSVSASPAIYGFIFSTPVIPTSVRHSYSSESYEGYPSPEDYTIEGSTNTTTGFDGTWTVLKTVTGKSDYAWTDTFSNTVAYKALRIKVTSAHTAYWDYVEMNNLWVYGNEVSTGSTSTGSCYTKDAESGKTLLPYTYSGTVSNDVVPSVPYVYDGAEDIVHTRNGYSRLDFISQGYRIWNWDAYANKKSYTGSLSEVLVHLSGSFVNYRSFKPSILIHLRPSISFGDESTTNFESSGSNAINYIRVVTDKGWHLEALVIKNNGNSSFPDNSEDWGYTRFDSFSGSVFLPSGQVARNFKIVFDDYSPTIFSIDWGSYTRTVSSETVCTPNILKINTYLNGQVTTATGQAVFVTNLTESLNQALINQSGSIVQTDFDCPKDITDLNAPGLAWTSWGFSKHVPILDFDIDVKPFGMLECPLKSIYLFTSKFQ